MTKILLLAANPKDTSLLQLNQEIREIDQAVHKGKFGAQFQFSPKLAVRLRDLSQYLDEIQPDIVHFSSHGNLSSEIILEDEEGNSQPLSQESMKEIFSLLQGKIRCVVLNACYAEAQANALAEKIDCVVGMLGTLSDKAAIEFAREFYKQLSNGRSVATAFQLGRAQVPNGKDVARLLAVKANPSQIFFVKRHQWIKYVAVIALAISLLAVWIFRQATTPGTSVPVMTQTSSSSLPQEIGITPIGILQTPPRSETMSPSITDINTATDVLLQDGELNPLCQFPITNIRAIAFSPDSAEIASAGEDGVIRIWSVATCSASGSLNGHTDVVTSVSWAPKAQRLASGSDDQTIRIWDVTTMKEITEFGQTQQGHASFVTSVAWSPNGKWLASAENESHVIVWNVEDGKILARFDQAYDLAWLPMSNGTLLVGGGFQQVLVFDPINRIMSKPWLGHSGDIMDVAWSPDGYCLAVAEHDAPQLILIPMNIDGQLGQTDIWANELPLIGHPGAVTDVAWSADSQRLASAGYGSTVRVWDVATRTELLPKLTNIGALKIDWSPDGKLIAAAGENKIAIWDASVFENRTQTAKGDQPANVHPCE